MANSKLFPFRPMTASKMLAVLIAVAMLTAIGRAKDKILEYKAYAGPALPPDQVSTLDSKIEFTLDGHDLYHDWESGSLREGCKPHNPDERNHQPSRCRYTHFLIRVLPGQHTIGVVLFAGSSTSFQGTRIISAKPRFSGPNCTPSSCRFSTVTFPLEAGKTYDVGFEGPFFSGPMFGTGITVRERGKEVLMCPTLDAPLQKFVCSDIQKIVPQ